MSKLLNSIQKDISKKISANIICSEWHSSILLEGNLSSWEESVRAGKLAANKGYKGVVNRIQVQGLDIPGMKMPVTKDDSLEGQTCDVLVIGGGIIGCSIARELSKWNINVLVIDKEDDLAVHASSRNDGMIHPGIEPKPGSKKALFNVQGNRLYESISKELDVPIRRSGSIVLFDRRWMRAVEPVVKLRAHQNGVEGVEFLSREEVLKREPYITADIAGGVLFPTTAVTSPYKMAIAFAENAAANGVKISLDTAVISIERDKQIIKSVRTNRGRIYPSVVINAAGVYADKIAEMASDQFFTIHPRKGEIAFLDRKKGKYLNSVTAKPDLMTIKGSTNTKGGGLVKTYEGNILVGPDAYEQPYREDYSTNRNHIEAILKKQLPLISYFNQSDVITYCAGIRASTYEEDFIVEKSEYVENLVYATGIQSPGFASAPAIALEIEKITCSILSKTIRLQKKAGWNPCRKGIPDLKNMSECERSLLIKKRPDYGVIICRCEEISRGEIIDAINSPIPALTLDAVKRRVRPGMGRCQGGFCTPLVMDIIRKETGLAMTNITKKGNESNILVDETKIS